MSLVILADSTSTLTAQVVAIDVHFSIVFVNFHPSLALARRFSCSRTCCLVVGHLIHDLVVRLLLLLALLHCLFSQLLLLLVWLLVWQLKLLLAREMTFVFERLLLLQLSLLSLLDEDWVLLALGLVLFYSILPLLSTTAIELALDKNMTVIFAFNYKNGQNFNLVNFSTWSIFQLGHFFNLPYY